MKTYNKVGPGVVSIRALTREGSGQGSGFVIDQEGHIVTNYHVVEDITDLEVSFPSGLKVRGEVLGTDLNSDLAVIKVDVAPEELFPSTVSGLGFNQGRPTGYRYRQSLRLRRHDDDGNRLRD